MADNASTLRVPHITIIGLGLMGGSLALAVRQFYPGTRITGCDLSPAAGDEAVRLGMIDEFFPPDALDPGASQIVFVATPVTAIGSVILGLARLPSPPPILTDMGSVKGTLLSEVRSGLPEGSCYIGGHPMCGSELEGLEGADPHLYENAVYILTPDDRTPQDRLASLEQFLAGIGAQVVHLDPETHDAIVARTSHLPYLAAVALVSTFIRAFDGQRVPHLLAAGGFRDTTRVASCPPAMWRDICLANRAPLLQALRELVTELESFEDAITSADGERLLQTFSRARTMRATLPHYRKGLLPTGHELVVKAQDRPGFLGQVAGVLGRADVSIRDLEVLRVREGEGGSLRLAFSDEPNLQKALDLLNEAGFVVRRRE
ncbi:MAG: prephenate dehydrogenase [Candidatus Riflebacteria bacterium]|nr:prephenate dehydrogenase [Candidatus Riflebacteria bacterium]